MSKLVKSGMNNGAVVKLIDVHKTYRTGEVEVQAVRGVSLEIKRGEFVALMGASGSGKSTLMNLLGCLDRPTRGQYLLDNTDVSHLNRDQLADIRNGKLGFVFQSFNLLPRTSARENVELPLLYGRHQLSNQQLRERADRVLASVGLQGREEHHPSQLSGGQQQRVALARALAREPALMLLDEPFSALDTGLRSSTRTAVARLLAEAGVTTLLVTHDQEEALSIADQVAVMRDGRFTKVGTPQQVYLHPEDRFTAEFLGDCVLLACHVTSGVAECALGRIPVRAPAADGPATLMLRPEQLVATAVADDERSAGIATVLASEFRGHDVLLTVDPGGDATPIVVRQHSVDPPAVDSKVRLDVMGAAVVLAENPPG